MGTFTHDLRAALRSIGRSPGITVVAIVSLALGTGANTAVFTLIDVLSLRHVPVPQPNRLTELYILRPNGQRNLFSYPMFEEMRRSQRAFTDIAAWGYPILAVEANGNVSPAAVMTVTTNYFSLLGVRPLIGSFFGPREDGSRTESADAPAVLGYAFWRGRYGGDPRVLGKGLKIQGRPYTIVGVSREEFSGLFVGAPVDVWIPLGPPLLALSDLEDREAQGYWISARLKQDITIGQGRSRLEALWPSILEASVPQNATPERRRAFLAQRIQCVPAATGIRLLRLDEFRRPLWVLMGAVVAVLLVACTNVATLVLARTAARQHEMGTRLALGATRVAVGRLLLTESLLLSSTGALAGLPLAYWISRLLASYADTGNVPLALNLAPDLRVLGFTLGVALLAAVFSGLAPVLRVAGQDPAVLLRLAPRTVIPGGGSSRCGKLLMAIQVVLSLVLLYGAALLTQSLVKQRSLDPGFRVKGVLGVMLHPNPGGYKDLDRVSYDRQLFDALSGLPGVSSVSLSALAPIDPFTHREALSSDSVDANAPGSVEADVAKISPGFFKTLGMSLLQGRDFYFSDDQRAGRVIIVSSALARRLFGSADPIGRVINVGVSPQHQRLRVIGIVGDARLYDIRQNLSFAAYLPFFQEDKTGAAYVEIAADTNLAHIAAVVRRTVNRFGREYVFRVESLGQREDALLASERAVTTLANGFAVLALSLAVVGLYGLMSYSVAGRTGEFGIRMAMGASPADVLHLVVRESLLLVSAAAVVGFPIAMVTGRTVSGILYGVKAISPMVLLASSGTLLVAGLLAAWIPARRASRIEPMTALRHE